LLNLVSVNSRKLWSPIDAPGLVTEESPVVLHKVDEENDFRLPSQP
jgi:hypothetical protein